VGLVGPVTATRAERGHVRHHLRQRRARASCIERQGPERSGEGEGAALSSCVEGQHVERSAAAALFWNHKRRGEGEGVTSA